MKKTATKKSAPKAPQKPKITPYKATIKVMGKTYEATGPTIKDAISNLKPTNCKGKGILVVSKGDKSKEKILMPALTFRLFNTFGMSKEIALKNAGLLFDL